MRASAIFDLDGCIADDRRRRTLISKGWDSYHEDAINDPVVNGDVLRNHIKAGHFIEFVTARPEKYREATRHWIANHFGVHAFNSNLWMRPEEDHRDSVELKREVVTKHIVAEAVVAAYDDREDVVEMYRSLGIPATVLEVKESSMNAISAVLKEMIETSEQRGSLYGKSYEKFGDVAMALWPNGIAVKSKDDFVKLGIIVQIIGKLVRYTGAEGGHVDSAHDMAVYSAMLQLVTKE